MRPLDIVARLCPNAKPQYREAFAKGDGLFLAHNVTNAERAAQFLTQVLHETGGLTILWESGAYSAQRLLEVFGVGRHSAAITPDEAARLAYHPEAIFERVYGLGNPRKAKELGNTRPGDGYRFRGGGPMQTTGGKNYKRMGDKAGVDFYNHPELIASAEHCLKPAFIEWDEGDCNDYADRGDLLSISRIINLGSAKSTAMPNGWQDRQAWFKKLHPLCVGIEFRPLDASQPMPATAPKPPPAPAPARKGNVKKVAGAGTVATGAGYVAHQAGLPAAAVAAIVVAVAVAAFLIFHFATRSRS